MLTPPISPALPTQLLNTHLGGSACGPKLQRWRDGKCLVKSLNDFVARLCLSPATSSSASSQIWISRGIPVGHRACSSAMAPAQGRYLVFFLFSPSSKGDRTGGDAAAAACSIR